MANFLNHAAVAAPRNGTTTHTVSPNGTGGTVVGGSGFTATAGRLLICFVAGPITSTTPSGWTLPTNGSVISDTGLYVFTKTAAGSDSLATTHNAADFLCMFDFYEFAAGSSFGSVVNATGVSPSGGAGPTLTGLTGTNWTAGIVSQSNPNPSMYTWTWDHGTEATEYSVVQGTNEGYNFGVSYTDNDTSTSVAYAATTSGATAGSVERLVVAVAPTGGGGPSTFTKAGVGVIGP